MSSALTIIIIPLIMIIMTHLSTMKAVMQPRAQRPRPKPPRAQGPRDQGPGGETRRSRILALSFGQRDAEEAARWGLINQIHPADQLHKTARKIADLLASGPPLVYAAIKEVVRNAEDMRFQDALNKITKSQFATVEKLYNSEDQAEGARAFAEKRDPTWKGQ